MLSITNEEKDYRKYSFPYFTARNCISLIIKNFNIKEIYIPYYTCPVVWQTIQKENCKIKFYHIDKNFFPTVDFSQNDYILYTNYFGINSLNVKKMADNYKNLIVDNAQAAYMYPVGIASFNSLRKFFNLEKGSVLHIQKSFINCEGVNDIELTETEVVYDKSLRLSNLDVFNKLFSSANMLKLNLSSDDIPLYYPYLCIDNSIEKSLLKEKIEYEKLWNILPQNSQEGLFSRNLLLFPMKKEYDVEKIQLLESILR
ncbi:hypothetical protein IJ182_03530 [bacterium]|nr:hypothetical protein [bacterium]